MGTLFALASAVCYGLADFFGGMLSRRMSYALVAWLGQLGGLAATGLVAGLLGASAVRVEDLAWGALSGVGTGVGMVFLYRAMSRRDMGVAVPVSAVTGIALPVVAGVVLLGERPGVLAWTGIVISVPALWLVSMTRGGSGAPRQFPIEALIAGVGIAAQYLALAFPTPAAGLWALAVGTLPALALASYTLAVHRGLLTTAVVLSSLYPVIPVVLGIVVLKERPTPTRIIGFAGAAAAVLLITGG